MFRRFGILRARCLLLRQDEILDLEEQLNEIDEDETNEPALSSQLFDRNGARKEALQEIREKLAQYGMQAIPNSLFFNSYWKSTKVVVCQMLNFGPISKYPPCDLPERRI